ncbi:hypothetical protein [Hymenobacter sp. CRA2]|uniref:hypothetical protein n=1 Tax=Hymenobacter sp. CRA2 TaxID=1955620 RepID=UPI00098F3DB6|nr:hypothetical protein [Hymenobacter sp. CRA2]OON68991.1 hypothetical protein B0919_09770 [Hymenobacter sp. CRA2]
MKIGLLPALLLLATALHAQTKPTTPVPKPDLVAANTVEARVQQYYADLTQRLRAIYEAPGDGRAISLLSTATEEFGARRKALRLELAHLQPTLPAAERQALLKRLQQGPWRQEQQAILQTPAAAKIPDRTVRNPALETALQRFNDARLAELLPADAATR